MNMAQFRNYLIGNQGLKSTSANAYIQKLRTIEKDIGVNLENINTLDIQEYFARIRQAKKINTQRFEQVAVTVFYRWLSETTGADNPVRGLKLIRRERITPAILNKDDVVRMIKACDAKNFINIRNSAMIALLADTGIRVGELIRLKVGNCIKDQNRFLLTISGDASGTKTYLQRTIPFSKLEENSVIAEPWSAYYTAIKYIEKWDSEEYLFQRSNMGRWSAGGKMTIKNIERLIARLAKKAGIEKHITPHSFRHFYATWCTVNDMRLETLQYRLGHKTIESTMIYIHLADVIRDDSLKYNPMTGVKMPYRNYTGFVKAIKDK